MAKSLTQNDVTMDEAQLKAAVRANISELESANQRMMTRQTRIDRLRAETRALLDQIKAATHVA